MSSPSGKSAQSCVCGESGSKAKPPKRTGPLLGVVSVAGADVITASFIRARQAEAEAVKQALPFVAMVVAAPKPTSAVCSAGCSQKKHSPSSACLAPVKVWIASHHSNGCVKLARIVRCCWAARAAASRKVLVSSSWLLVMGNCPVVVDVCAPVGLDIITFILLSSSYTHILGMGQLWPKVKSAMFCIYCSGDGEGGANVGCGCPDSNCWEESDY